MRMGLMTLLIATGVMAFAVLCVFSAERSVRVMHLEIQHLRDQAETAKKARQLGKKVK